MKNINEISIDDLKQFATENNVEVAEFTISPLADELKTDKNQVSSPRFKFYKVGKEIYADVKLNNLKNRDILNKISAINLSTDNENQNNCDIHLTYLDNKQNSKFNSVIGMDISNAKKVLKTIRNDDITLKINNKEIKNEQKDNSTQTNLKQEELFMGDSAVNQAKPVPVIELPKKQTKQTILNLQNENTSQPQQKSPTNEQKIQNELTQSFINSHKNEIEVFEINHTNKASNDGKLTLFKTDSNYKVSANQPLKIYKYKNDYFLDGLTYDSTNHKATHSIQKIAYFAPREQEYSSERFRKCTIHTINNANQKSTNTIPLCKVESILPFYDNVYKTKSNDQQTSIKTNYANIADMQTEVKMFEFISTEPEFLTDSELQVNVYNYYQKLKTKEASTQQNIQEKPVNNFNNAAKTIESEKPNNETTPKISSTEKSRLYKGQLLASELGVEKENLPNVNLQNNSPLNIDESKFQGASSTKNGNYFDGNDTQSSSSLIQDTEIAKLKQPINLPNKQTAPFDTQSYIDAQTKPIAQQPSPEFVKETYNDIPDDELFSKNEEIEKLKNANINKPNNQQENNKLIPQITAPNAQIAKQEENTPPLTSVEQDAKNSQSPEQTKKEEKQLEKTKESQSEEKKEPPKPVEPPKETKTSIDLWKNPLKDLTSMGIKCSAVMLLVMAFLGAVSAPLFPLFVIGGALMFVFGDDIINYIEKGVKKFGKFISKRFKKHEQKILKKREFYKSAEFDKKGNYINELARKKLLGKRLTKEEKKQIKEEKIAKSYRWKMHKNYIKRDKQITRKSGNKLLGIDKEAKVKSYVRNIKPQIITNKHGNKQIVLDPKSNTKDDKTQIYSSGYDEMYKPRKTTIMDKETITQKKLGLMPIHSAKKPIKPQDREM